MGLCFLEVMSSYNMIICACQISFNGVFFCQICWRDCLNFKETTLAIHVDKEFPQFLKMSYSDAQIITCQISPMCDNSPKATCTSLLNTAISVI